MKLEKIFKLLILFSAIILFILPAFATGSSCTQTVSVTIPETTAATANFGNSSTINVGISQGTTEVTVNNVYFANPSNVDTELWIKASGDLIGANTANIISLSNLKFVIPGLGITGELTDQYTKAGVIKKSEQRNINSGMGVNLQVKVPYGIIPDIYETTIYFTSVKLNSDAPV